MATFIVPKPDPIPFPTLGPAICDLIEERAVFGPGSLKGEPAKLDKEKRAIIYKAYELYPQGHELAGKRRFRRVRICLRKGTAKTELLGWIGFVELHPEGPVRFDGWDADGNPVGRPVRDPYIPMLAYTVEQVEELAYNVLYTVCTDGPDADLFDSQLSKIVRLDARGRADGKAVPLANSPNARDGARTTFQAFDETHRLTLPSHIEAYNTMEANLPKRPLDEPWSMGITTAGVPGQNSVAELDKQEAEDIASGKIEEPELFYMHRQASAQHDLKTYEGRVAAITEASGPEVAKWSDIRGIAKQWDRPNADPSYLERVWCNRWTQAANHAFDFKKWRDELGDSGATIPAGAQVSVGFDGSRWDDSTALIVTELATGLQVVGGYWLPADLQDGEVDPREVDEAVDEINKRYKLTRLYGDPAQGWDERLAQWAGKYGPKKIIQFYTDSRNLRRTASMCRAYATAIRSGEVRHDGNDDFAQHIGNSQKRDIKMTDEDGTPLWIMQKEKHKSPKKIDLAMAGGLSWQARLDSIAAGLVRQNSNVWYTD